MPTEIPAAPAAAITTDNLKPAAPGPNPAKAAATQSNGQVKVKPVRPYLCSATREQREAGGEAYPVDPSQAAQLVANKLAEYDNPDDETAAIEARIRSEAETARASRKPR